MIISCLIKSCKQSYINKKICYINVMSMLRLHIKGVPFKRNIHSDAFEIRLDALCKHTQRANASIWISNAFGCITNVSR